MTSTQQNGHIYVELTSPEDLGRAIETVRAALGDAGIGVVDLRAVTRNEDGHIVTDLLISGIWDHETGKRDCDGPLPGLGARAPGLERTDSRTAAGVRRRYAQFMTNCREDQLDPDLLLQDAEEFGGVALASHSR